MQNKQIIRGIRLIQEQPPYLWRMNKGLIVAIFIFLWVSLTGDGIKAQSDYPPEGVYTTFYSFRRGEPDLIKSQLIRSLNSDNSFTIRQWSNTEHLYYLDKDSATVSFDPDQFWGIMENGTLYLYLGMKFHKVMVLGSISYFLESYPTIRNNVAPVITDLRTTSAYRLVDMDSGDIFDYELDQFEELLARDQDLFLEFDALESGKTKRRKMYSYLEKFNARHPLQKIE